MITSGMNTDGVPCTIISSQSGHVPQIEHIEDKKLKFSNLMESRFQEYFEKLDRLAEFIDNTNMSKKAKSSLTNDINTLRIHIKSNTNYTMTQFNKAMEKTVTEAKQSISGFIESKVVSMGLESLKKSLEIDIEPKKIEE
jgi:hypothetical protein